MDREEFRVISKFMPEVHEYLLARRRVVGLEAAPGSRASDELREIDDLLEQAASVEKALRRA